jgi:hypothetical protein
MKGYDENISRVAAENMLEASIVAKLLSERNLKRIGKVKGAQVAVFVDKEGRIHYKEMLVYDPKLPVYCQGEGRPSVPADSGIPCLTKRPKKMGKGPTTEASREGVAAEKRWRNGILPAEAREIVESWRAALSEAARATPVKKVLGRHPLSLLDLPDRELWPIIWSQSQQTLIQEYTFLPKYGSKITGGESCSEGYSAQVCKEAEDQNLPPQQVKDELDRLAEVERQLRLATRELRRWCNEPSQSGLPIPHGWEECRQRFREKCDEVEIEGCIVGGHPELCIPYDSEIITDPPILCRPAEVREEVERREELARQRTPNSGTARLITGFTWDEDEKWSKTKRTCVDYNPLWPGCTRYWIKAYYHYSYVFGLRIPLLLEVESSNVREDREGTHTGVVTFNLTPFNGNSRHYDAAGMPNSQVYSGREALASLCHRSGGCGAGLKGDLPGPNPYLPLGVQVRTIDLLHEAFSSGSIRNGQIDPPDVGDQQMLGFRRIDFDLMGEMVNLGIVGAEILPLLRLDMGGKSKRLAIAYGRDTDCADSPERRFRWDRTGDKTNAFEIPENSRDALLYKPSYTFDLTLKLGLEPALWVDFGVWDHTWRLTQTWLPWGISSPNFTLDTHANTHCGKHFAVTTETN